VSARPTPECGETYRRSVPWPAAGPSLGEGYDYDDDTIELVLSPAQVRALSLAAEEVHRAFSQRLPAQRTPAPHLETAAPERADPRISPPDQARPRSQEAEPLAAQGAEPRTWAELIPHATPPAPADSRAPAEPRAQAEWPSQAEPRVQAQIARVQSRAAVQPLSQRTEPSGQDHAGFAGRSQPPAPARWPTPQPTPFPPVAHAEPPGQVQSPAQAPPPDQVQPPSPTLKAPLVSLTSHARPARLAQLSLGAQPVTNPTGADAALSGPVASANSVNGERNSVRKDAARAPWWLVRIGLPLCVTIALVALGTVGHRAGHGSTQQRKQAQPPVARAHDPAIPPKPAAATSPPAIGSAIPADSPVEAPANQPVRFKNPFDASEVFEFPPGTSTAEARRTVAAILLQRGRERVAHKTAVTPGASRRSAGWRSNTR
jgi:hypothetical protein